MKRPKLKLEIAYGRTELGQSTYDTLMSSLAAKEVCRRHPLLTRDFVLYMRKKYPKLRRERGPRRP